jgi:hypothetical protein
MLDDPRGWLMLLAVVALVGATWVAWRRNRPKPFLCPKCGGDLDSDPYHYRYTVFHTCKDCGGTFETPKSR